MKLILHPKFIEARKKLIAALDNPRPGHMIFLIGPTGFGKTTLRHSALREVYGDPAYWPMGKVPLIEVFPRLPENSYFTSKGLANSLLDELRMPSLQWIGDASRGRAVRSLMEQIQEARDAWPGIGKRLTEDDLWRTVERMLGARSCGLISIDQVTALLKNRRTKEPADHMLHLMILAERAGITFLMTGVPEAVVLWGIHPELRRRVEVIWTPPYSEKVGGDRVAFAKLLSSMPKRFPMIPAKTLLGIDVELLAATGGLLGGLEGLLRRAQVVAMNEGGAVVTKEHIESAYPSDKDLKAIWWEIHSFERVSTPGTVSLRAEEIRRLWS